MTTFPILEKGGLDEQQKKLWDEMTQGHRSVITGGPEKKRMPDLFNAWLQFPEFGHLILRVADALRANEALSHKLRELVILTTSMLLNTRVEYDFHVPRARANGLPEAVIEAIGRGEKPEFSDPAERIIYQANVELVRVGTLSDNTRESVVGIVGYRGLMLLIALIGMYVIVGYTSNVSEVRVLDDFQADEKKLEDFYKGKLAEEYRN
ncbi:MAG: carboxymuconolactone decarboxylase family protein [Steroidobacteraceae bacterium]